MATATLSRATRRHKNRLPLAIFCLGTLTGLLTIALVWRAQRFAVVSSDPYGYVAMARSLLNGEGFAPWGSVLNRRGPLFPASIALVYLVTGEHPEVLQLAQALMHGGVCLMAFDIGRRLYGERTALIAGLLCAVHPALLRYVPDFHIECFLTFLATVALWRSARLLERPDVKNGALFGIAGALGALAKPVLLLYPVAFAAWWLLRRRRRRLPPRWPAAAAILVAMGVVILPWTYRNYRTSGHAVLITTGTGDAFLRGFVFSKMDYALLRLPPYTYAENESNAMFARVFDEAGAVWQRDDIETERILVQASRRKLLADPRDFVRKFVVQLFTFWYETTSVANSLVVGVSALVLWILALVGWRRARAEGRSSWPLFLPILCLNLSLAALLALGRYSVPILPALAILGAFGVDTLLVRRALDRDTARNPSAPRAVH